MSYHTGEADHGFGFVRGFFVVVVIRGFFGFFEDGYLSVQQPPHLHK